MDRQNRMTPQKLSDLRVRVRYAEHGDYEEVIQNLKPVYGGNDYLIVNYHDFIRDRNVVNFVGEIDGKVVAYRAIVFDGPKEGVGIGARVHPQYSGRGVFQVFRAKGEKLLLDMYPRLETYTWTAMDRPTYQDSNFSKNGAKILERWYYPVWYTTKEKVAKLIASLEGMPQTLLTVSPQPEEAIAKLSASHNAHSLFPSGYIIGYYNWLPQRITDSNIRRFVGAHRILLSMASAQQVAAVSFLVSQKVPRGSLSGIHYYQNGADLFTFLHHMKDQMKHIINITNEKDEIVLYIRPSSGVNMDKVKEMLYPYLGSHKKDKYFHNDTGVFCSAPIKKPAKL